MNKVQSFISAFCHKRWNNSKGSMLMKKGLIISDIQQMNSVVLSHWSIDSLNDDRLSQSIIDAFCLVYSRSGLEAPVYSMQQLIYLDKTLMSIGLTLSDIAYDSDLQKKYLGDT
ncbi:hypothetical protein [Moorena sp. SIO2C4]|uniref:hypothetical protein n=1 Tax=Moorena sp. SIO2C4 TaxID=2607824 RepID=UPI0013CC3176|nr:hypothetical protein [Moorena sp. SIO2C4]NES40537.1 hypothetical protein [Moorena sp. SIO2C4]